MPSYDGPSLCLQAKLLDIFSIMAGMSRLGICFQNPIELTRTKSFCKFYKTLEVAVLFSQTAKLGSETRRTLRCRGRHGTGRRFSRPLLRVPSAPPRFSLLPGDSKRRRSREPCHATVPPPTPATSLQGTRTSVGSHTYEQSLDCPFLCWRILLRFPNRKIAG